jgi:hypothetical protein
VDRLTVLPKGLRPEAAYQVADPFRAGKARTDPEGLPGKVLMGKGLRLSLAPESALVRHLIPAGGEQENR